MRILTITLLLCCLVNLQACVGVATLAIVTGANMAADNRTLGKQIDDQGIELKAKSLITTDEALDKQTNLHFVSINGALLIIGQAPNTYLRDKVIKKVSDISGVTQLHDQIRITNNITIATATNDIWLTSKVKTALLSKEELNGSNIKVITENAEVFLMGLVKASTAKQAIEIARNISGVNRVINAFEYQD